jgi:hypothetical protein
MKMLANGEAFDCGDFAVADDSDLCAARALGGSVDEHGASAALSFAAAVLRSGKVELVA